MSAKKVSSRWNFLKAGSLFIVVAILLAACGQATPAPTVKPAEPVAAEPTAEPTVDPNAPTPEPTPVVNAFGNCSDPLILYHGLTGSDGAVFAEMLQQYKAANPDACFESQGIAWDLFFQKFPTSVMAGNPPDMVIYHAAEVMQMTAEGLVLPMDDFYTTSGIGKDQFNESLIDQITVDGKTMTVPFDNHGWMNWINTKVIKDAGLDPNDLPQNSEEFIEWAQKITTDKNGKHPNEAGFDKDNVVVWAIYWTWLRYTVPSSLWQYGGAVVSDDGKTALLGSPESIAAIQFWHDLMYKYYVCPPGIPGLAYGGEMYESNGIAMWWEGTWTGGYMRDRPEVAAVTQPSFLNSLAPDGKQAVKFDSHVFSIPVGVPDNRRPELYKMIQFLLENGAYWANAGQVPALKSVQTLPEVLAFPSVAIAAQQFNEIGSTDFSHKAFIEIQTAYETAISAAVAGPDVDVAKALQEGNAVIQAILDRP